MNIEIKFVDQRYDGVEGWIRTKDSDWVRLDFLLEYFLSSNISITKKYSGQLNSRNISKQYCEELLSDFKLKTSDGKKFDFPKYKKWLSNEFEIEKARKMLN